MPMPPMPLLLAQGGQPERRRLYGEVHIKSNAF